MSGAAGQLAELAGALALSAPPEGAGVTAAGVVALAAGLCESVARASLAARPLLRGAAVQAAELRLRAAGAGEENGRAYEAARLALEERVAPGASGRDARLLVRLTAAADTLLAVAAAAGDCAALGAELAGRADPALRADVLGAGELAVGAARAAARLIEVNLVLAPSDERRERAVAIVSRAEADLRRALAAGA